MMERENESGLQTEDEYLEWLETEVCLYCCEARNDKMSCCGENHWALGKETLDE